MTLRPWVGPPLRSGPHLPVSPSLPSGRYNTRPFIALNRLNPMVSASNYYLVSDNFPQYASVEFAKFADEYNFKHVTSSPYYPQSNGCAERAVQTVKKLMEGSTDPYFSLLTYRTTPLSWCGYSPAELLMGRKLQANLPLTVEQLIPDWSSMNETDFKQKQKKRF